MCVCLCVSEHGCVLVLQIYRERDSQRFVSKRVRQIKRERERQREVLCWAGFLSQLNLICIKFDYLITCSLLISYSLIIELTFQF